jgi:hypothetical protein
VNIGDRIEEMLELITIHTSTKEIDEDAFKEWP